MNHKDYDVRVENGVQFLYYKGKKLPDQLKSVVVQDLDSINNGTKLAEVTITVLAILKDTK